MYTIPLIDYGMIGEAQRYYAEQGYVDVPVPWIVQRPAYYATKPSGAPDFFCLGGYLNASGEQSFIEMLRAGVLLRRNQCATPCFREEPELDRIHHRYFMKVELIDTDTRISSLERMMDRASAFLARYLPVRTVRTGEHEHSYDIVSGVGGVELGSYGIRVFGDIRWVYGTGLALPRLTTVMNG